MQTPKPHSSLATKLAHIFSFLLHHHLRLPKRTPDTPSTFRFLSARPDLHDRVLVFHAETALLRSPSLFPYFLLVALEAGSFLRALALLLLYPLIALLREDRAIRAMVAVCFFGLKEEGFLEGSAVLPKYFLEDVGKESFEVLRRAGTRVAVSDLPRVMVERFLVDYLEVDVVVGREMRVWGGYFVGVMEGRKEGGFEGVKMGWSDAVGVGCFRKGFDCRWFSNCKEIYLVSEQERSKWQQLPRDSYPKPLIFHDGRLAFRPTFLAALAMFLWLPVGFALALLRLLISLTFPSPFLLPALHLTGARILCSAAPPATTQPPSNRLFVCNHRTLLDPLVISYCLKSPLAAVVYSLSRVSEILSPIRTVRLTRSRDRDADLMRGLLRQGDLVVCPEGTTCREPYLLRFSPLFTEIKDRVFPVAMRYDVSLFYGTTARGFKSLDSLFFLMNPWPTCEVRFLDPVDFGSDGGDDDDYDGDLRCRRANMVQRMIAEELGFTCTRITRKEKYMILAGNEGVVKCGKKQ